MGRRRGSPNLGRAPLRPDTVVLCGDSSCEEFSKVERFKVRAVIECKNQDPQYWLGGVEGQVIPYKQALQPDTMLVASLKRDPESIKTRLHATGITDIGEVYYGGRG